LLCTPARRWGAASAASKASKEARTSPCLNTSIPRCRGSRQQLRQHSDGRRTEMFRCAEHTLTRRDAARVSRGSRVAGAAAMARGASDIARRLLPAVALIAALQPTRLSCKTCTSVWPGVPEPMPHYLSCHACPAARPVAPVDSSALCCVDTGRSAGASLGGQLCNHVTSIGRESHTQHVVRKWVGRMELD